MNEKTPEITIKKPRTFWRKVHIEIKDYPLINNKRKNIMIIKLPRVRLAFADLFVPKPFKPGDDPKYGAAFLLPKDSELHKIIDAAIIEVVELKWPGKSKQIIESIRTNPNKFCFQDGDSKSYDGYQGMMAVSAKNKARPLIVDRNKTPLVAEDGRPYSGCYVEASIELFAYDNTGKGVSASLRGVRFLEDGDAFAGGAPASVDEFADLEDGADSTDLV